MRPSLLCALALGAAAGCGLIPPGPDGGALIVPSSYKLAAEGGGHKAHVGAALADGGLIACGACHDLGKDGFLALGLTRCGDCHAERAGFHHGGDAGLPDGGHVSCTSCHPFLAPVTRELPLSPWECIGCHQEPMGSKQPIKVHGAACSYCHEPHRTPFTQPTECTACHPVDLVHGAPKQTVAQTCMGCHQQHRPAVEATPACLACHSDRSKQKSAKAVVTLAALLPQGHVSCGSCHKPHRFSAKEVKGCTLCHADKPVLAQATNPKAHPECKSCHLPHDPKAEPKACTECHGKLKSTHPVTAELHACKSCHPPHTALPVGPTPSTRPVGPATAVACESCHAPPTFTALTHGAHPSDGGTALTCNSCHPPHAFQVPKGGGPALCKGCHREEVAATAKVKKLGHAECTGCHQGLPHAPEGKKPCLECHAEKADGNKGHLECSKCHAPHTAKVAAGCKSCHGDDSRFGLHQVRAEGRGPRAEGHQNCKSCHTPHGAMPGAQKAMCLGACHKLPPRHDPNVERCTGCHLFVAPDKAPGLSPGKPP